MQSIRFTPEHVEQVQGDALSCRSEGLARLQHVRGAGPPDLMWLRKVVLSSRGVPVEDDDLRTTFYHWLLGQDVSSAATVAAYFAELCENVERPSFIQGLWSSQEYKVVGGTYCCFDAFSRLDLRCDFAVPGGVTVHAVDASGNSVPVTHDIWVGACVSGFLRSNLLDLHTLHRLGGTKRVEPVASLEAEDQLLVCVEHIYRTDALQHGLVDLQPDSGQGVRAEDTDLLCATLYHFFRRRQRLEQACDFFSQLVEVHVEAAMYAAMAEHELDLFEEAMKTLEGAVRACPGSAPLKVALGQRLLEAGQITRALTLAREALKISPHARWAWLLLANAYVAGEEYSLALIAANLTPPPPEFPDLKMVLGSVPPPAFDTTKPQATQYDPEIEEIVRMQAESEADGNDDLLDLPASSLLPLEPMSTGRLTNIEQHRATTCVYAAVYDVMVDIVEAVGWDNFLEERGVVFLMNDEIGSSSDAEESLSASEHGDCRTSSSSGASSSSGSEKEEYTGGERARSHGFTSGSAIVPAPMRATTGHRTPPPPGHCPAAAPPPSSYQGQSNMPVMDTSAFDETLPESADRREGADGVNPQLWSLVYGGAGQQESDAGEGVAAPMRRLRVTGAAHGDSVSDNDGAALSSPGSDGGESRPGYSSCGESGSLEVPHGPLWNPQADCSTPRCTALLTT